VARSSLEKYPRDERVQALNTEIHGALANALFEAGDTAEAKKAAQEWLDSNTAAKAWYYGNVIHDANSLLGQLALREGDQKTAGHYLLMAGQTPGSPQLDSFGPDFTLAAELLAAGEKAIVLKYLDLVEKFWVKKQSANSAFQQVSRNNAATLQHLREDIQAGQTPTDPKWKL